MQIAEHGAFRERSAAVESLIGRERRHIESAAADAGRKTQPPQAQPWTNSVERIASHRRGRAQTVYQVGPLSLAKDA